MLGFFISFRFSGQIKDRKNTRLHTFYFLSLRLRGETRHVFKKQNSQILRRPQDDIQYCGSFANAPMVFVILRPPKDLAVAHSSLRSLASSR
jgi:hypothetical protein